MERYSYAAYGLGIRSSFPIPHLPPGHGETHVTIDFADLAAPLPGPGPHDSKYQQFRPGVIRYSDPALLTIEVREGRQILVDPAPDADQSYVVLTVVGWGMGHLLHQRGFLVLHGSALAIGGGVVAFLGPVGVGKSTTAAALYARGHTHVADDVIGVCTDDTPPEVQPGPSQFRLWPEAATAVGYDPRHLDLVSPVHEKRMQSDITRAATGRLPLRRIFVLSTGERLAVETMPPRDAFAQLLVNSYAAASLLGGGGADHRQRCLKVVATVPIKRLVRTEHLEHLTALAAMIEADL